MKSTSEIVLPKFDYNLKKKEIYISIPDGFNLKVNGNLNIEINGEVNLLSHSDINIDSYNSCIWLNSLKCKQLDNIDESNSNIIDIKPSPLSQIRQQLSILNNRILELESNNEIRTDNKVKTTSSK